jgi:hypothetical protein
MEHRLVRFAHDGAETLHPAEIVYSVQINPPQPAMERG